ncbi:hypothetical protein [Beijerinckia mobilis]|uniref:hypothetical protein n=1 Tax=Beijerinckia mobilis TaxID=231434 RepID=UPI0005519732|nr:hypothetical protein [Beijerinckia mobilis]
MPEGLGKEEFAKFFQKTTAMRQKWRSVSAPEKPVDALAPLGYAIQMQMNRSTIDLIVMTAPV